MVNLVALIRGIRLELAASDSDWLVLLNKRVQNLPLSGALEGAEVLDGSSFRPLTPQEKASFTEERDLANETLRLTSLRAACLNAIAPVRTRKEEWKERFQQEKEKIGAQIDRVSDLISSRRDMISDEVQRHNDRIGAQRDSLEAQIDQLRDRKANGPKDQKAGLQSQIDQLKARKSELALQKRNASTEKSNDLELTRLLAQKEYLREQKSNYQAPEFPESKALAKLEETLTWLSRACVESFRALLDAYRRHSQQVLKEEFLQVRTLLKAEGDVTIIDGLLTSFGPVSVDGVEYSIVIETPIVWRGGSLKTRSMSIGSISGGSTISTGSVISGDVTFW